MTQPLPSPSTVGAQPHTISLLRLHTKLRHGLEENIATCHPWKQLLGTASEDTRVQVLRALEAYVQIWYASKRSKVPDDGRRQGYLLAAESGVANLCKTAEQDLEKGLNLIREVEKGSHMKADALLRFRPEAIAAFCELCRGRIEELRVEMGQERDQNAGADDGSGEDEEEGEGQDDHDQDNDDETADTGCEETRNITLQRRLMQDPEVAKDIMGTVYRHIEPQFKTRLQHLVHQHKKKGKSK